MSIMWKAIGKSTLDGSKHPRFRSQLIPGLERLCGSDESDRAAAPNECVIQVRVCGYNLSHMFGCKSPSDYSQQACVVKKGM